MRYLYAKFKGYIGFYNGLGLNKVEIDFSKCKSNIVLIVGTNGCGKSTLMNAINPFPDPSASFTPGIDAEKILTLFNDGDTYKLRIISPADSKGGRKQAKAFIEKNGVELNENGNITSYKEIIFSEFELDASYITLSALSGNDRGLGDKTPAERKRFSANIVDNLEVYNDLYKNLNKKSLIFKSNLNNLHTKIQNIGNRENLQATLLSLQAKDKEIQDRIMQLNNMIVSITAKSTIDQDEAIRINQIRKDLDQLRAELASENADLGVLIHKTKIDKDKVEDKFYSDNNLSSHYSTKIHGLEMSISEDTAAINNLTASIQQYEAKLTMYRQRLDAELENRYNASSDKLTVLYEEVQSSGFKYSEETIEGIKKLIKLFREFVEFIDSLYSFVDDSEGLRYIVEENYEKDLEAKRLSIVSELNSSVMESIRVTKDELQELETLETRPKECSIDVCPFINKAISIRDRDSIESLTKKLDKLIDKEKYMSRELLKIDDKLKLCSSLAVYKTKFHVFASRFSEMENELLLVYLNPKLLINKILTDDNFDYMRSNKLSDVLNLMLEYKSELETNRLLREKYEAYKDSVQMVEDIEKMLNNEKEKKNSLVIAVSRDKKDLDNFKSLLESLSNTIEQEKIMIRHIEAIKKTQADIDALESRLSDYYYKSSKMAQEISEIVNYKDEIAKLTKEDEPIRESISRISGQLTLLDSYYTEYEAYKEKYNVIETLKKYCSPTGGGIQTLFMQLYMGKTLELANKVLRMLFNGEYQLLDFVINHNEFRIPFIGLGLPVDDISSGSASQICIMGMVINLVLLYQASTKYNIAKLDEVDGPLDHRNRIDFVNTLYRIIPILKIEQMFLISHSIETDASNVDIIKLKTYDDYEDNYTGNVIYDYRKETNE